MTLQDVIDYQNKWIKGRTYTYCILGDKKELDINALKKVGPVIELKQEDICLLYTSRRHFLTIDFCKILRFAVRIRQSGMKLHGGYMSGYIQ